MTRPLPSLVLIVAAPLFLAACDDKNPASPSPTPTPAQQTRIISITGDLSFGGTGLGQSSERPFRISNTGNSPLTVTGMTVPSGGAFAASWIQGTIAAGGSQDVVLRFTPTEHRSYSGTLTVTCNNTSGQNTIPINAQGLAPLWSHRGTGDTVFDMPAWVARVRIVGTYSGNSSNFIVKVGGRLLVNELLGTFWGMTRYDGTLLTNGGGVVEITNSSGVTWSFDEVR